MVFTISRVEFIFKCMFNTIVVYDCNHTDCLVSDFDISLAFSVYGQLDEKGLVRLPLIIVYYFDVNGQNCLVNAHHQNLVYFVVIFAGLGSSVNGFNSIRIFLLILTFRE